MNLIQFHGPNAAYVLELYERYRQDPLSVDAPTRSLFNSWDPSTEVTAPVAEGPAPSADVKAVLRAAELARTIRESGHLVAALNPLGRGTENEQVLDLATHDLSDDDLRKLPAHVIGGTAADGTGSALDAVKRLRGIDCSTSGYEFGHVEDPAARAWLVDAVETGRFGWPNDPAVERNLLERLSRVEAFERFLQRTFPGQTRFSVEGTDSLVPMLDAIVESLAEAGICELLIGMAHRGRLNVMAHVLGRPIAAILADFQAAGRQPEPAPTLAEIECPGWTGDVKYHLGGQKPYPDDQVFRVLVKLLPDPSHLESVDPLVVGMARAAADGRRHSGEPQYFDKAALPVLIHGDASFTGQGVVAETFNLARLPDYRNGGTLHVVVDNQLGFTAGPEQTRSTRYASDLAKGFGIPIVQVNADDPRACIAAVRLAFGYRQEFHGDFLVDLIGYRRRGHNEGDEPAFTQPLMYDQIASHPTVREIFAGELADRGIVTPEGAEQMLRTASEEMQKAYAALVDGTATVPEEDPCGPGGQRDDDCGEKPDDPVTAVAAEHLVKLNSALVQLPAGFTPEPKLARLLARRAGALEPSGALDWGHAEMLAFASILADGTPVRLTGQDTVRGTFSQRHAVLHDRTTGATYSPLVALPEARASFDVADSPLSEVAALGFEYGYSVEAPEALVLWEAQYGDFVNGAQVILDQFIVSGWAKWGQESSLVLLLPHGYEGQGPEHSSARLERFLQLAANGDIRVVYPSTAAQYFHLLRQQAGLLKRRPRPLVILTPKSLLRNPSAGASLVDLAEGAFHPVLDDAEARSRRKEVTRLILCSGKVYYDLLANAKAPAEVAVARVEQLYPFPAGDVSALVAEYPSVTEVVWLQEEPENMGGWRFVAPRLAALVPKGVPVRYVGRPEMASPAEGRSEWHSVEQARILKEALAEATPARRKVGSR